MKASLILGVLIAIGSLNVNAAGYKSSNNIPPHYQILNSGVWQYLSSESLPNNHCENIKSVTFITPIYDGDEEDMTGSMVSYNYNHSGKLISGNLEYGDAVGGYSFKIEYNDNGMPSKIIWTSEEYTQDPPETNWTVITEYVPIYDNEGKLQKIEETTVSVGGKNTNNVHTYMVTPSRSNVPLNVVCMDDNNYHVNFDNNGNLQTLNIYTYTGTYGMGSKWELIDSTDSVFYHQFPFETSKDINWHYTLDSKGNWTKRTGKAKSSYDGSLYDVVEFCKIEYF